MRTLTYLLTLVISMFSTNLVNAQPFFIDEEPPQYVNIPDSTEAKMKHLGFQEDYLQNDDGSWSKVILVEKDRITPPTGVSFTKEEVKKLDKGEEVVKTERKGVFFRWSFQLPPIEGFNVDTKTGYTLIGKSFLAKKYPDSIRPNHLPIWMFPLIFLIGILTIFSKVTLRNHKLSLCFAAIILAYVAGSLIPTTYMLPVAITGAVVAIVGGLIENGIAFSATSAVAVATILFSHNTTYGRVGAGITLAIFLATLLVIKWRQERKLAQGKT